MDPVHFDPVGKMPCYKLYFELERFEITLQTPVIPEALRSARTKPADTPTKWDVEV